MEKLTVREILAARKAGGRLARMMGDGKNPSVTAACRNACLLAAALRDGEGRRVYRDGLAVLLTLSPASLLAACEAALTLGGNPGFDAGRFLELAGREESGA